MAREIQSSILPQELPGFAGYDFGAFMQPMRAVEAISTISFPSVRVGWGLFWETFPITAFRSPFLWP